MTKHPDYKYLDNENPLADRCVCGGIRYWHAVWPYGCDDCECGEFLSESDAIRQSLADTDAHYRTHDRTIEAKS